MSNHKSPWQSIQDTNAKIGKSNESLKLEQKIFREQNLQNAADIAALNRRLLASDQPEDLRAHSNDPCPPPTPEPYSPAGMIQFVKSACSSSNGNQISPADLENVLSAVGLDCQGRPTKVVGRQNFVKGIRFLCNFHFGNYCEEEQADIMGELLFNCEIFSKTSSRKLFEKSTRSFTSCIFNGISVLKRIDAKAGSLNDRGCDDYSKIEFDSKLTSPSVGKSMLRPRHNITRARKIANGLVKYLFSVETNAGQPLMESHEDMVLFNPERLF